MSRVPRIRFKGFEEDWEQRKLSEIALRVSNLRLSSSDLPCVEYEDVVSEAGILNNDIQSKEVVKAGILFDDTHVLYGKLRPYLHNWLCPDFSGVAVGDWWVLKPCYVAREFIYRIIQTKRFDNSTNQSSGSKMPRADWNLVSNTEFMISSDSSEQEKIGLYFKKLDHLITLHQRKLEKLKIIKKSMLENLFPQNGEKTPKIRFSGFTKDWEQRKVIDIAETRRGLTYKPTDICDDGIRVLRSSNINEDKFVKREDDIFVDRKAINIPFVQNGDILITSANGSSRLVGKHAIIREITDSSAVHGGFMLLATAKNPQFLNAAMGASWYIKFINLFVAGGNGAIGNLNKNDLDEQTILVPYEIEQVIIGRFFENLDHLITLHQSKLEKLQKIKKSLLESMFV